MEQIIRKYKNGELSKEEFIEEVMKENEKDLESTLTFKDLAAVESVFHSVFKKSVGLLTKVVKKGGSSAHIYVPWKYRDHPVTVVVWDKEKFEG